MIDDLLHLGACLGQLAVANGLQQQVAQRVSLNTSPNYVENFAAVGFPLFFDLFEQADERRSPSRVLLATMFNLADFLLADAVDTAEPLFDAIRTQGRS